jgi:hypothetical protein
MEGGRWAGTSPSILHRRSSILAEKASSLKRQSASEHFQNDEDKERPAESASAQQIQEGPARRGEYGCYD